MKITKTTFIPLIWLISTDVTAGEKEHIDKVQVTYVSEKPAVGSGVLATWLMFRGIDLEGNEHSYYLPYLAETASIPVRGDNCEVKYSRRRISGFVGNSPNALSGNILNAVSQVDCVSK